MNYLWNGYNSLLWNSMYSSTLWYFNWRNDYQSRTPMLVFQSLNWWTDIHLHNRNEPCSIQWTYEFYNSTTTNCSNLNYKWDLMIIIQPTNRAVFVEIYRNSHCWNKLCRRLYLKSSVEKFWDKWNIAHSNKR